MAKTFTQHAPLIFDTEAVEVFNMKTGTYHLRRPGGYGERPSWTIKKPLHNTGVFSCGRIIAPGSPAPTDPGLPLLDANLFAWNDTDQCRSTIPELQNFPASGLFDIAIVLSGTLHQLYDPEDPDSDYAERVDQDPFEAVNLDLHLWAFDGVELLPSAVNGYRDLITAGPTTVQRATRNRGLISSSNGIFPGQHFRMNGTKTFGLAKKEDLVRLTLLTGLESAVSPSPDFVPQFASIDNCEWAIQISYIGEFIEPDNQLIEHHGDGMITGVRLPRDEYGNCGPMPTEWYPE